MKDTMKELFLDIQGLEESSPEVKADVLRYRQGLEPLSCNFLYQYFLQLMGMLYHHLSEQGSE